MNVGEAVIQNTINFLLYRAHVLGKKTDKHRKETRQFYSDESTLRESNRIRSNEWWWDEVRFWVRWSRKVSLKRWYLRKEQKNEEPAMQRCPENFKEDFKYQDYEREKRESHGKRVKAAYWRKINLARVHRVGKSEGSLLEVGTGYTGPGPRFTVRNKVDCICLTSMYSKWYSLLIGHNKATIHELDFS